MSYINNLAKLTPDFIPGSKFDSDQTNYSLGTTKALNVSTQRQAGSDTTRSHQRAPFYLGMATVFVVAIFFMLTDIKMV